MPRVKFSIILPDVQVLLAVGLQEWAIHSALPRQMCAPYLPTPMLICYGIDAPAIVLRRLLLLPLELRSIAIPLIVGFRLDDIVLLFCVAFVWYFVGKRLDTKLSPAKSARRRMTFAWLFWNLSLLSLGVVFFFEAIDGLRYPGRWDRLFGRIAESILFLIWAQSLLSIPVLRIVNEIRRKFVRDET
jgi:hypothetical protein